MIAGDLLRHREANQNGLPALVLTSDIPRLKRSKMGFLKTPYARYRNTDPPDEAILVIYCIDVKYPTKHSWGTAGAQRRHSSLCFHSR
jgi:hypothetical protein